MGTRSTDEFVSVVRTCLRDGLIKQVKIIPQIDPALFTRDCTLSGTSPKGVLRLRLAMKYCRRQHTLEEVVCLVNARTGMDPPYTFRDFVEDLWSLDQSI